MAKVSIIIPVYNTGQYLQKCLESVRNQTLQDIEIICVDDGSTDTSPEVLDEYAKIDPRIQVIHKRNGGLVSARKAGIAAASGSYAGYVDSDDWIEPDMYETLYHRIKENQTELVTCGYYLEGRYTTTHLDTVEEGLYRTEKMRYLRDHTIYRMECRETGLRGGLWCKLFLTSLLKEIQVQIPDTISIAEDKACLLRYILECSSVYVYKKPLYHWAIRPSSMSHESKENGNNYLLKMHYLYNYLMTLYNHPNFTDTMRRQVEIYMMELIFLGINKRMGFRNRNMIWIDPCWLEELPPHAQIILYGSGELGEKYRKQLASRPDLELKAMIDENLEGPLSEECDNVSYDYIVITIKNREKARHIKEKLKHEGIPEQKILWREQPEAFWRFVEAEYKDGNEDGFGSTLGSDRIKK